MANGMGSLFIGVSGLQSAQTALNTTAHNLSNINTTGYTRQQIGLATRTYLPMGGGYTATEIRQYGLGVDIQDVRRVRNDFVDEAYRTSNGRYGFYSSQYEAVEEVEDLFGELQGVTYQECLADLRESINELAKNPQSTTARTSVIQRATAFMTRSTTNYNELIAYQKTLNTEVQNMIDKINSLGEEICTLNRKILDIEGAKVESANDLRDQRDNALDELSNYIKIDYYSSSDGRVVVIAEGTPFVTEGIVNKMSSRKTDEQGLLIPTWPMFDCDVFNPDFSKANSYYDTDFGKLKGLIIARGNCTADYSDVPVEPDKTQFDLQTQAGQDAYALAQKEYEDKQKYYNQYIEPSAILSAMAGMDKLVNGIVEQINDILCPEKEQITATALQDADGNELNAIRYEYNNSENAVLYNKLGEEVYGEKMSEEGQPERYKYDSGEKLFQDKEATTQEEVSRYTYSFLDLEKTSVGMDADQTVGCELFARFQTQRYTKAKDADGNDMYVRNNFNQKGELSYYTLGNIDVNKEAAQNIDKIPLSTRTGKEDFIRSEELVNLWNQKFASLNPESYAVSDYMSYYSDFISEFAMTGQVLDYYVDNHQVMMHGYDNQRTQVSGVASDEELEKMIKYQQAYNAASRYINVVDEMMEHLINTLGRG